MLIIAIKTLGQKLASNPLRKQLTVLSYNAIVLVQILIYSNSLIFKKSSARNRNPNPFIKMVKSLIAIAKMNANLREF